jgi:hypothetical protein
MEPAAGGPVRLVDGQAEAGARAGGQCRGSGDVGDDRDGTAARNRLGREQGGGLGQLIESRGGDDPCLLE